MGTFNVYAYDSTNVVPVIPSSTDITNIPGDLTVAGNMTVSGSVTTIDTTVNLVQDNMIHLSHNYETDNTDLEGGLVITVEAFTNTGEQISGASNAVNISGAQTFSVGADFSSVLSAGDIVQIQDAEDAANNGLYELHSVNYDSSDTTIVIKGAGNAPNSKTSTFVSTSLTTNSSDTTIKIHKVQVGVIRTNTSSGIFETGFGSSVSTLSYSSLSAVAADDISAGDAAVNLTTTSGNITIDAQANDSDIIFKGTDGSVDTTFLTIDGSEAGTAIFNNDLQLKSDASVLSFGADLDVSLTHVADTGLLLNAASVIQFRDADISIGSGNDGVLDLTADTRIDLNAATTVNGDVTIAGTTPTLTIGDNGAEDVALVFDNGSQDYYIAIDHSDSQKLLFGLGSTVGSSAALTLDSSANLLAAGDLTASGRILVDDATDATSTTDGSLQTDGGLSVAKDAVIGNDLKLLSDSAVLSLGAGSDATFTHDGTTGLTIAATPISIDSTGSLDLSSTDGDINFQDGGTNQLSLDLDGTAGEVIMKLMVDSDDFVFKQYDGTEVFRVEDNGDFDIAGGAGSSGVTISAAGQLTADGRIIVDDTTDATSVTDGSLQTDGGLSVKKSAVVGGPNLILGEDAEEDIGLFFKGNAQDYYLGLDDSADSLAIGLNGSNPSANQIVVIDSNANVTMNGGLTVTDDLELSANVVMTANKGIGYKFTSNGAHSIGNILYFGANGKVQKADADALASSRVLGVALEAASAADESKLVCTVFGSVIDVLFNSAPSVSDLVVGAAVYLDTTNSGFASHAAPTGSGDSVVRLGYAVEAGDGSNTLRQIIFAPELVSTLG